MNEKKTKLRPALDGAPWLIGPNPTDLGSLQGAIRPGEPFKGQEPVDHHIWRDAHGDWRCWSCIRHTAVGRILYGWKSRDLEASPWEATGVMMRRDQSYGESLADRPDAVHPRSEWLQSPFVARDGARYYMFYGGECQDPTGRLLLSAICLATSNDGIDFTRHVNPFGKSWVFMGPGEARDPCLITIGGTWLCYYSGAETGTCAPNKVYVRTSKDLVHWSGSREVHWGGSAGSAGYQCECPHVVYRKGYYYLFRTKDYWKGQTYVYRSADPFDFGIDNDKYLIGQIDVAAPEIVVDGEKEYISSNKDLMRGVMLHRLKWVSDA